VKGAGKSYSMVMFTRKVHRKLGGNFTFLVLTDTPLFSGILKKSLPTTTAKKMWISGQTMWSTMFSEPIPYYPRLSTPRSYRSSLKSLT